MASKRRAVPNSPENSDSESNSGSAAEEDDDDQNVSTSKQQDPKERRELRSRYRQLIEQLSSTCVDEDDEEDTRNETTVEQSSSSKILEHYEMVKALATQVSHTREGALDSQAYSMLASNAKNSVQSFESDLMKFIPEEFAEKLITFLEVDRVEFPSMLPDNAWVDLGQKSSVLFRRAPCFHTFAGSFDMEAVQPKVRRQPRVKRDTSVQKPTLVQQIAHDNKVYEEKTTEQVENILRTLNGLYARNKNQPLCYFKFVVDPTSFSRTVENIFHTSFLVKDGHVKVHYDEFQLPVIEPVTNSRENGDNAEQEKFALAMGISVSEWQELKTTFQIEQAVIKRKD